VKEQSEKMFRCIFSLLFVLGLLLPQISHAHGLRVFAYGEGEQIVGEVAFSGGRRAKGAEISVEDRKSGKLLYTTHSNEMGEFVFLIPDEAREKQLDLRIVALAGEAHRSEWLLDAGDYLTVGGKQVTVDETVSVSGQEQVVVQKGEENAALSAAHLEKLVEAAVARQLGPVKEMLLKAANPQPGLRDILGGIGYLLGLAGIVAYFKARKKEKQ
jgi:nickel transport protein